MTAGQLSVAPITEREWQEQVTDLAALLGWEWMHLRAARTARGWRTPVSGTIGTGFPDLVLSRERLVLVELKSDHGRLSPEQRAVHQALGRAGAEVYVWRPGDWDRIVEVLSDRLDTDPPTPFEQVIG